MHAPQLGISLFLAFAVSAFAEATESFAERVRLAGRMNSGGYRNHAAGSLPSTVDEFVESAAYTQEEQPSRDEGDDEPRQPETPTRRQPSPSRPSRRQITRLLSVPNMWGDFGGGIGRVHVMPPTVPIFTIINDGVPVPLTVTNSRGNGASLDVFDPITITDAASGTNLTMSIPGAGGVHGVDASGDQQPDTYLIAEPAGLVAPPGPGTLTFVDGRAIFVGVSGANTITTPADGSLDRADGWNLLLNHAFTPDPIVAAVSTGGMIRHIKIAENNSPMPRCRVFFDYNFYNDPILGIGDVSRYIFGFEHTFYGGLGSFALRVPFASTLNSDQVAGGSVAQQIEFGNVSVIGKVVLWRNSTCLVSGGLGIATPTAERTRLFLPDGTQVLDIDNQAVLLQPFIAAMSSQHPRWFWQAFLEWALGANGNPVKANFFGGDLSRIGVLQDATMMFVDLGIGYRLYENNFARGLTAIRPMVELHYGTSLQDADVAAGDEIVVSNSYTTRLDVVNLTLGADFVLGRNLHIRPAIVVPLSDGDNELFDYEAGVQVNLQL
jgi:hypothetical protein